jgi:putative transposase
MPGPKAVAVLLTNEEKEGLQQLTRRHNVGQQIAKRARIVLAAAEGKSNSQIARELDASRDMARHWRQRWVDLQPIRLADLSIEERLEDLPRPGTPGRIPQTRYAKSNKWRARSPKIQGDPLPIGPIAKWPTR